MSDTTAASIFGYFRDEERDAYKGAIATLAGQRKLRPVFVTQKPLAEQYLWLRKACSRKQAAGAGEHLLQIWLLRARTPLLVAFLDTMEISHDGNGAVDELPETMDGDKLKGAVDKLLADFPAEEVAIYLHVFQMQTEEGWPELGALLASDERLAFGVA